MKGTSQEQPPPLGDGEELKLRIVEVALEIGDVAGVVSSVELLERFPGCEATVAAALRALGLYETRVARDRRVARAGVADELLECGAVVGDYEIEGVIGHGTMGVVYRARQRSLGARAVALKVLPPALVARDPRFLERFRREAALASEVHDARLAEVYGFGEEDGLVFFAMRLIEGRTLGDVVRSLILHRRLGDRRHEGREYMELVVRLMREVALATGVLHKRGLVHRDIKPSNIILEGAGESDVEALGKPPVLVDFGLLKPVRDSELTGSQTLLGTPAYASPEAKLGHEVGPRADVFALGAMLHELLSLTAAGSRTSAPGGLRASASSRAPTPARTRTATDSQAPASLAGARTMTGSPAPASAGESRTATSPLAPASSAGARMTTGAQIPASAGGAPFSTDSQAPAAESSQFSMGSRERRPAGKHSVRALNPAVDERLDAIVGMALDDRAELRYADGGALLEELERYLNDEPVQAFPETAVGRARLWSRRHPERAARLVVTGILIAMVLGVVSFVAGAWAFPLYRSAGRAAEFERKGDLLAARWEWRAVYESGWGALLPFTAWDQREAAKYWSDDGVLTEPLAALEAGLLDKAHLSLQRVFASSYPGEEADLVMRFLAREIRGMGDETRRLRAVESTARLYLSPRQRPHATYASGSPGEALFDTLIDIVEAEQRGERQDPRLLRSVVSTLGGTKSRRAFEAILPLLTSPDFDLRRVGLVATVRLWWALRGAAGSETERIHYPALLEYEPSMWIAWASQVSRGLEGLVPSREEAIEGLQGPLTSARDHNLESCAIVPAREAMICLAWTRMEQAAAGQLDDRAWSALPGPFLEYLLALQAMLESGRDGVPFDLASLSGIPVTTEVDVQRWHTWFELPMGTFATWAAPEYIYQYPASRVASPTRRELLGPANPDARYARLLIKPGENALDRIQLEGAAKRLSWTGRIDPAGLYGIYLALTGLDDKMTLECSRPIDGDVMARVRIRYQTPAVWPLPHTGGGKLRVSINSDELVMERFGFAYVDILEILVPRRALTLHEKLEIEVRLASNSLLWIHEIDVRYEKIPSAVDGL